MFKKLQKSQRDCHFSDESSNLKVPSWFIGAPQTSPDAQQQGQLGQLGHAQLTDASTTTCSVKTWHLEAFCLLGIKLAWLKVYPLVNIQKTMERSTIVNGKIHYFDWAIFNSYVCLPEGTYSNYFKLWFESKRQFKLVWEKKNTCPKLPWTCWFPWLSHFSPHQSLLVYFFWPHFGENQWIGLYRGKFTGKPHI